MENNTFAWHETTLSYKPAQQQNTCCKYNHYPAINAVIDLLKSLNWNAGNDNSVNEIIRDDYFIGENNELKFKGERHSIYPNASDAFSITFYTDLNAKNPHGGYYDSDKFTPMPYLMQKRFQKLKSIISEFLIEKYNATDTSKPVSKLVEPKITHVLSDNQTLKDVDGTPINLNDRDGKPLINGEIKYFRDYSGYLCKGRAYWDGGNIIALIVNDTTMFRKANFEIFDLIAEPHCRIKRCIMPNDYIMRRKALSDASTKELLNELKRRNIHVKTCKRTAAC